MNTQRPSMIHHRSLLRERAVGDRTYFSDHRDIALGFAADGFAPFKMRKHTAWILIFSYNISSEHRSREDNILWSKKAMGP
jgi:hypothetical protein